MQLFAPETTPKQLQEHPTLFSWLVVLSQAWWVFGFIALVVSIASPA